MPLVQVVYSSKGKFTRTYWNGPPLCVLLSLQLHGVRNCKRSASLVDSAIASGKLFHGEGYDYIRQSFPEGTLHLIGLLSNGGVHSRYDQLQVCRCGLSTVNSCGNFMLMAHP